MNNLKRVLSLALSGIMLVGMMAMGASAADFTDAEDIQHDEAVNILVALKVINGQDDGSFNPQGDVTRAQMAKMIAVAMNGGKEANTGVKTSPTFTDIKGHWAESYIEYCSDLGIISGRGDGTFDPDGNVTGLEATKMVLTALGYDSTAYRLTGASWAVQTDELARKAEPYSLYEELEDVVMSNKASREVAAQLIWNGLQDKTRKVTPQKNTSNGETTWVYEDGPIMIKERYDAEVREGIFYGNYNTGDAQVDGEINVNGWSFPYDLDIAQIGEIMKVVWKDGTDSKNGRPDKRDTIYGVFNTSKTEVYHTTMADMQGAGDSNLAKGKIKFGGVLYEVAPKGVDITYNYDSDSTSTVVGAANVQNALKHQQVDEIKFVVCNDSDDVANDGKIEAAYVTVHNIGRVTGVSSDKITLQGIGTIEMADNDIYKDVKKDDVVNYTRFYDNDDKDGAFFTVTKAETVEGELIGFKKDKYEDVLNCFININVDGTTYKVEAPATNLRTNLTDDYISDITDVGTNQNAAIGDTVRLYMLGNMVGCVEPIDSNGGKYAVVTEVSGADTAVDSNMKPLKVTVLFADGTEETLTVHKDSTFAKVSSTTSARNGLQLKIKDVAAAKQYLLFDKTSNANGNLIEYSAVANGSIKIKSIATMGGKTTSDGTVGSLLTGTDTTSVNGGTVTVNYAASNGTANIIWDEDAKKMVVAGGNAVASTDAVLFTGVDRDNLGNSNGVINDWYANDLRAAGSLYADYKPNGSGANSEVQYYQDTKGLVVAASMVRGGKAIGNKEDTLYGIVTGYVGTFRNSDNEEYWRYTVAVGRDEDVEVRILQTSGKLDVGNLVTFDERSDAEYEKGNTLKVLVASDDTLVTADEGYFALAAVREYRETAGLLLTYGSTNSSSITDDFDHGAAYTYTVSRDAKIFYVDGDNNKQGNEMGVTVFDTTKGYANALLYVNDKGVVDVIIVETSGKANLAHPTTSGKATADFGTRASATMPHTLPTVTGSTNGATYSVAVSHAADDKVAVGDKVVINITCTKAPNAGKTDEITLAATGVKEASSKVTFTSADLGVTKSITLTVNSTSTLTLAASVADKA